MRLGSWGPNAEIIGEPGGRGRLDTPALVLDIEAFERNLARMAAAARASVVALRPHAKTHKSAEIAQRQIAAGAVGVCCATVGEAEALTEAGVKGLLVTSPIVTEAKIRRIIALSTDADRLMVVADDPAAVAAMDRAASNRGRPLTVLVDLDVGTQRTGCPSVDDAVRLARQIDAAPGLRFAGVQGYQGSLQHVGDFAERKRRIAKALDPLARLVWRLAEHGLPAAIVTGAGTGSHEIDRDGGLFTELQPGSYIFMDAQYNAIGYRDGPPPFETALTVAASVVSARHDGFVTVDAGIKAFATDGPVPEVVHGAPEGTVYSFRGDEHGRLTLPPGAPPLPLGTVVELRTPHCDPTVNLYDRYHVCRRDTLAEIWQVDGRGRA